MQIDNHHNITQNNETESLDVHIEAEIRHAINKLKSDRCGGPDGSCIEMLKAVIDDVIPFLTLLLMAYIIKDFI